MIKIFIALLTTILLTATAYAANLPVLSVQRSVPEQTKQLTLVAVQVPAAPLLALTPETFQNVPGYYWQATSTDGKLAELYVSAPGAAPRPNQKPTQPPEHVTIYGLLRSDDTTALVIYPRDASQDDPTRRFDVSIDPTSATPGDPEMLSAWSNARSRAWARHARRAASTSVLKHWFRIAARVYDDKTAASASSMSRRRGRGNTDDLNAFSIFSGEAAIQETLQQQLLDTRGGSSTPAPESIAQLQGPEVPSHPFDDMLGERPGGQLDIANLVPPARYFVHFNSPAKMFARLDQLGDTSAGLAGLGEHVYLRRELLARQLQKLHLSPDIAKRLSPLARQTALFGADLYLSEGSDMTLLVETDEGELQNSLFAKLLGATRPNNPQSAVSEYGLLPGVAPAYFARNGNVWIFSSRRAEAEAALELAKSDGKGSLGKSAEFRYMLEQLPARSADEEGILVYLSDAFIRALTGPGLKIGQYRRYLARTRLYALTAAALLYRLDHGKPAAIHELLELGYVQKSWIEGVDGEHLELDENGLARSDMFGSLAEMTPVGRLPIDTISVSERDGYRRYVENYSRFWRTFFDPIAVRISFEPKVRIETLILPLVNNSIYDNLQSFLGNLGDISSLPALSPQPVATLSLPRPPLNDIRGLFGRRSSRAPDTQVQWMEEHLGSGLHIAVYDSDPLLAIGSADIAGAFSGFSTGFGGRGMIWLGILGAFLTQPTALLIELNSDKVFTDKSDLRRFVSGLQGRIFGFRSGADGELQSNIELIGDSNTLVYTIEMAGFLRFHLFAQQVGNYLAISNWRADFKQLDEAQADMAPANAALQVFPGQTAKLRQDLLLHQLQKRRKAAESVAADLLPFLWLGAETPGQAAREYQQYLGAGLPPDEDWRWDPIDRRLGHRLFGSKLADLPEFRSQAGAALDSSPFKQTQRLQLHLKFEEGGARIVGEIE